MLFPVVLLLIFKFVFVSSQNEFKMKKENVVYDCIVQNNGLFKTESKNINIKNVNYFNINGRQELLECDYEKNDDGKIYRCDIAKKPSDFKTTNIDCVQNCGSYCERRFKRGTDGESKSDDGNCKEEDCPNNKKPYSEIAKSNERTGTLLGVNVQEILSKEKPMKNMVVFKKCPFDLSLSIYESVMEGSYSLANFGYDSEASIVSYIDLILIKILSYINKSNGIKSNFLNEENWTSKLAIRKNMDTKKKMYIDIGVTSEKWQPSSGESGKKYKVNYKLIIEVKKSEDITTGTNQVLLYLKDIYDENKDNEDVYGFSTNGNKWRFVIFGKNGFKVSEEVFLFPASSVQNRYRWLKYKTLVLDTLCSLLKLKDHNNGNHKPIQAKVEIDGIDYSGVLSPQT